MARADYAPVGVRELTKPEAASRRFRAGRLPFVVAGMVAMAYGAWLGLVRLGWNLPLIAQDQLGAHGPLMVCGFLGTLIAVERAIALGRTWGYAAPLLTAAGAALLLLDFPMSAGAAAIAAGSLVVVAIFGAVLKRQASLFAATMAVGSAAWAAGNLWWLRGAPVHSVVYWWVAFLVLTIAGERLELNRLLRQTRWVQVQFIAAIALLLAGVAVTVSAPIAGVRVCGVALLGLTYWLARFDIARRTVRTAGLTRYMAVCLLAGYVWLGLAGLFSIGWAGDFPEAGLGYDAALHAVFLGFAMSMVFGHAPVIFPAVLGVPIRYGRWFYAHLAVLHASVAIRVAGDLVDALGRWRAWGGILNGVALLMFVAATAHATIRGSSWPRTDASATPSR